MILMVEAPLSSRVTAIVPFTRDFPYDIVEKIVALADKATLQTLGHLSRAWNEESNKHIWRTVHIFKSLQPSSRNAAKRACRYITRDNSRTRWIRNIFIRFRSYESRDWAAISVLLRNLLRSTTRLETLSIYWGYVPTDGREHPAVNPSLIDLLNSNILSFQLRKFSSDFPIFRLVDFFKSQPTLEFLNASYDPLGFSPDITSLSSTFAPILPNLSTLAGQGGLLPSISQGKPISSLVTTVLSVKDIEGLMLASVGSTIGVREITICIASVGLLEPFISKLHARPIPTLTHLAIGILHSDIITDYSVMQDMLASFSSIETMTWAGLGVPEFALEPKLYTPRNCKYVIVSLGLKGRKSFARTGKGPWTAVEPEFE